MGLAARRASRRRGPRRALRVARGVLVAEGGVVLLPRRHLGGRHHLLGLGVLHRSRGLRLVVVLLGGHAVPAATAAATPIRTGRAVGARRVGAPGGTAHDRTAISSNPEARSVSVPTAATSIDVPASDAVAIVS